MNTGQINDVNIESGKVGHLMPALLLPEPMSQRKLEKISKHLKHT